MGLQQAIHNPGGRRLSVRRPDGLSEKNKTSGWIEKTLEKFTSRVMEII